MPNVSRERARCEAPAGPVQHLGTDGGRTEALHPLMPQSWASEGLRAGMTATHAGRTISALAEKASGYIQTKGCSQQGNLAHQVLTASHPSHYCLSNKPAISALVRPIRRTAFKLGTPAQGG